MDLGCRLTPGMSRALLRVGSMPLLDAPLPSDHEQIVAACMHVLPDNLLDATRGNVGSELFQTRRYLERIG